MIMQLKATPYLIRQINLTYGVNADEAIIFLNTDKVSKKEEITSIL